MNAKRQLSDIINKFSEREAEEFLELLRLVVKIARDEHRGVGRVGG